MLRLLGNNDTSWAAMRAFLGEKGVTARITGFDARTITPDIYRKVWR